MNTLVTSLRGWWRPQHIYLPLPNSVRSPHNPTLSMYSKLGNNHNEKSPGRDTNDSSYSTRSVSAVCRGRRSYTTILLFSLFFNAVLVYFTFYTLSSPVTLPPTPVPSVPASGVCPAPLPNLFSVDPPSTSRHPRICDAIKSFKSELQKYYKTKNETGDIDSVAIAVVTREGSLVEAFHGPLKANDTSSKRQVDRNSMYRIASVSKLFTALETFILREKGALNLDDPVSNYIEEMRSSKSPNSHTIGTITIRQLLSHMSGIGRDWPPGDATHNWPESLEGKGPPPYSGVPTPNRAVLLEALDDNAWVADPYTYPVYSNTGYALLGLVNRIADKIHEHRTQELSHAKLLEQDIFGPLGFTDSSFLVSDEHKHKAAVSIVHPSETFLDFGVTNPAVGQLSSLSDFVLLAKALLNSSAETALLSPVVMREWLRPLHNEWDGYTSVGMPWEIYRQKYSSNKNSNVKNKTISIYQKLGDVISHQAGVTLIPTRSAAIVVLSTGKNSLVGDITQLAIKEFMPAFDDILAEEVDKQLGGRWTSADESTTIELEVNDGSLYAVKYNINGTDALETLQGSPTKKMALWSVGNGEYRLSPSRSSEDGCAPHWIGLDAFAYANGSPVNLLHLRKHSHSDPKANVLNIPSMKLDLKRLD